MTGPVTYRMADDHSPAWHAAGARPGTSSGWVPCPAQDAPAEIGAAAWSKRLTERNIIGPEVLARYGVTGGFLTGPDALVIGAATRDDVCQGLSCGHKIARGQACGASMTSRYCCCCVTTTEPASTFLTPAERRAKYETRQMEASGA